MSDVLIFRPGSKPKVVFKTVSPGDTFVYAENQVQSVGNNSNPPVNHQYTVYEFTDRNMSSYLIGACGDKPGDDEIQNWISIRQPKPI